MNEKFIQEDLKYILHENIKWESFEGKTILITGANGLLAYYLVRTLLYLNDNLFKTKCKVLALCRNMAKANDKFGVYFDRNDFDLLIQDVCQEIKYENNIHFIIHAASQASPKYYGSDPVGTINANVLGTNNILKLSYEKKVESVLFFSSSEVYGEVNNYMNTIKETDFGYLNPTVIRSCYAESKRLGETMCVAWNEQYGVPVKIVRPFHTYGPGIIRDDGRVFSDFIYNIIDGKNIIMKSDGTAKRAFCHISDATRGFFTVLLNGENGEAYNVGNSHAEVSIQELAVILIGLFPERKLKIIKDYTQKNSGYIRSTISRICPNLEKIKEIGWEPKISIEKGFKQTILSYN